MDTNNPFFNVFYRDFTHDVGISSAAPEPLARDRLAPLAEKLLTSEDNYLGIVDGSDTVLQLYQSDEQTIVVELIYPKSSGCMQLRISRQNAMLLLSELPEIFPEDLLPGAAYIG